MGPIIYFFGDNLPSLSRRKHSFFINKVNDFALKEYIFFSFNDSTIRTLIKDVNRVKLNGNCCVILFQGLNYGKQNQTLPIGFDDTPEVKTIRSFEIEQCHNDI